MISDCSIGFPKFAILRLTNLKALYKRLRKRFYDTDTDKEFDSISQCQGEILSCPG
jgi:hypothetical protein